MDFGINVHTKHRSFYCNEWVVDEGDQLDKMMSCTYLLWFN